jgi:hypothetical protein
MFAETAVFFKTADGRRSTPISLKPTSKLETILSSRIMNSFAMLLSATIGIHQWFQINLSSSEISLQQYQH